PPPPVLADVPDQTVVLGAERLVPVAATDADGDPVALSAEGLPSNSYFLPASGLFCFFGNDESKIDQPIQVTFTASDGVATDTDTATIRVVRPDAEGLAELAQPSALQFEPLGNPTVRAGETLTLPLAR